MKKITLTKENRTEVFNEITRRIKKHDCDTIYVECNGKEWAIRRENRKENDWKTRDIVCRAANDINEVLHIEEGYAHRLPDVDKTIEKIMDLMFNLKEEKNMKKMTVNKFNYKEVADQVAEMLKEDKNAKIELVCGDKTYYPRAYRALNGEDFILALCDVKNGFIPYEKGFDMKCEGYERIYLNDCPEDDFKYLPVLLRIAVSDIPEEFKFYYLNILLAERGLEYTDKPYYTGTWEFDTPRKGWEMIERFWYKKEKGGFDFEIFLYKSGQRLPDEPAFKYEVKGFPVDDEGIEMALLEVIDIFDNLLEELK